MTNPILALRTYGGIAALLTAFAACGGGGGTNVPVCKAGAFSPCGGDPTGTWRVTGMCSENNLTAIMNDMYAAESPECTNVAKSVNFSITGTVTYNASTVTYNMNYDMSYALSLSSACISGMMNMSGTMSTTVCSLLETGLTNSGDMTATCKLSGSNCDCDISQKSTDTSSDTYTISGSTITEELGDSYDFCVNGNTLSERQDSAEAGYAVLSLTKS